MDTPTASLRAPMGQIAPNGPTVSAIPIPTDASASLDGKRTGRRVITIADQAIAILGATATMIVPSGRKPDATLDLANASADQIAQRTGIVGSSLAFNVARVL